MSTQPLRLTLAGREHVAGAGTTAGAALAAGRPGRAGSRRARGHRRAGQRRAARSGLPGRRRGRDRAGPDRRPGRARDPAALHHPRHGAGRAGPVPRRQAGYRPAGGERLLLRLRLRPPVRPGGPEGDRAAHAPDRQAGPAVLPPRGHRRRRPRRTGRRAVQAGADRAQGHPGAAGRRGVGRGGRRRADHLRQPQPGHRRGDLEGPVPRPAHPDHPVHPGVQADALRWGVLAGQREEPAAAADLRHRVGIAGAAGRVPDHAGRGRAARPPQARRGAGPVLLPHRDRQRAAGVPPQGRDHPPGDGGLLAAPARGGRVPVRHHPARDQGRAVRDLRSSGLVRRRHVPAHGDGRADLLQQADELPDARADLHRRAGGPTGNCRCGCSSSAPCTGTRSPGSCTA